MPLVSLPDPYLSDALHDGPLMAAARLARPARLAAGPRAEDADQIDLVHRWRWRIPLHHSPNGGHLAGDAKARARQSAKHAAMGRATGFPDLIFVRPFTCDGTRFSGLAIEMKKRDGVPSDLRDDQRAWLLIMRQNGWMAEWCRGYHEADRLLELAYGDVP